MKRMKTEHWAALVFAAIAIMSLSAPHARADNAEAFTAGAGRAKFDGLLQAWSLNDTTSTSATKFNFRMRRAELKFSGSVIDDSRWFVMIDPAKSMSTGAVSTSNDNKILQDLGVAFSVTPELEVVAGEFKIPTTAEGSDSSGELLLPERSYVGRTFGDKREPGLMLTYKEAMWKFSVMASNGQKTNVDDTNSEKDLSARLDVSPNEMLKLGTFTTGGDLSYQNKARWGLNARVNVAALFLRAEGVHARDGSVTSNCWTLDAGYQVNERFQPVARYEGFSNSTFTANAGEMAKSWGFEIGSIAT